MKIAFYSLIVLFIAGYTYQKDQRMSELLLENIEAFSDPEHTDGPTDPENTDKPTNPEMGHDHTDETLVPYSRLSSMDVYIGDYPYPTKVPCCEKDPSKYSGCAKGLSGCK
ncbi:hypothetical protein [Bacteroides nordii]|uniref:hypothetical protein n=1 Tax=Bacteroides nordii TaxID=291645 RepID=UPI00399BB894